MYGAVIKVFPYGDCCDAHLLKCTVEISEIYHTVGRICFGMRASSTCSRMGVYYNIDVAAAPFEILNSPVTCLV